MSGPSFSSAPRLSELTVRLREPRAWMSLLVFCGAVIGIAGFTLHGLQSDRATVQNDGVNDDELDGALLSLGAVGVSDSANPTSSEAPGLGPLDLTRADAPEEPAPLFALEESSPAIMFEQATVTTGPLFGAPVSTPSSSRPDGAGTAVTANGVQTTEFAVPRFGMAIPSTDAGADGQDIRPVSGTRSAAWLTGTIE